MKALLVGLLLASPPVAAWMLRAAEPAKEPPAAVAAPSPQPVQGGVKVPVEVVAKGSAPQWVYVEVSPQSIPEPGVPALATLASLLLLRRKRPHGK